MSNPGAASTQTTNYLFNGNASDGVLLGISGGKVGFYGETPVVQASAITTISDSATGTANTWPRNTPTSPPSPNRSRHPNAEPAIHKSRPVDSARPAQPLVALLGVSKAFDGVAALKDVSLDVLRGEVHAVVGENGAFWFRYDRASRRMTRRFMQDAAPAGAGAMAAVLGLDLPALQQVCANASLPEGSVQCANLNAPGQVVISGEAGAVERASAGAREAGAKKVIPLAVSVPAHSALMRPAAERFAERIASVPLQAPSIQIGRAHV